MGLPENIIELVVTHGIEEHTGCNGIGLFSSEFFADDSERPEECGRWAISENELIVAYHLFILI